MTITIPAPHHLCLDPSGEWIADDATPTDLEIHGLYLRSVEHGIYLNVRAQEPGPHALTRHGLLALLREQNWASPPFDEWVITSSPLTIVGGTFETVGMGGEVVLEVFVADGCRMANLASPGVRQVIVAATPAVKRLAGTLLFGACSG